jgi:hypothetical protein
MAAARSAHADCGAISADDKGERYRLGAIAVGASKQEVLKAGIELADCKGSAAAGCQGEDVAFGDGANGLRYYLRDGHVFRLRLDDISHYQGSLIGDVLAGESIGDVRTKINRLTPAISWSYNSFHGKTNPMFSTDLCWQGAHNSRWAIMLFHNAQGRLVRIEEAADLSSLTRTGRDCPGDVVDDIDDHGSLGQVLFGTNRSRLPSSLKPMRTCPDDSSQECPGLNIPGDESYQLFIDRYGVRYWANDVEVVRKELLDIKRYPASLIADIKAGDSHEAVEKKLHGLGKGFPDFNYSPVADDPKVGGSILSDICMRSSNDAVWSYEFDFNRNDRLSQIKQEGGPLPEQ